ncbi:hypothetical protein PIB30_018556 [Stylosanthes scabra]|uniref:K Homology domain-containing protein n=1 Tax=Stylosanthes scabra TaxID=79078 RepID=A0ABU6Q8U5_9FABA|nr:hypothetical protein [Stylosanthes scabra]
MTDRLVVKTTWKTPPTAYAFQNPNPPLRSLTQSNNITTPPFPTLLPLPIRVLTFTILLLLIHNQELLFPRMGETGKRYHSQRDHDGDRRNQKRRMNDEDEKANGELVVYRILCPEHVIGSVIGKNGKVINSIRQETRARIQIVDPFPGAKDRVITVYCYVKDKQDFEIDDDFNGKDLLCPAQDALLKIHVAIMKSMAIGEWRKKPRLQDECQLLVPSSQAANIIGKAGSTIKKLRTKTKANIKVVAKDAAEPTHSCAMDFDNFVLITGESEAVERALFAVSSIMYKFGPKEDISLDKSVPEAPPSIIIPSEVPFYPPGGLYPVSDSIIPPRSLSQILGAANMQDVHGYADAGNTWPIYSSSLPAAPGALPAASGVGASRTEELVIRMLCPSDKIGRVIGKGGSTIKSMRQAIGARIEVDDSKAKDDECLIIITTTESPSDMKSMAVEAVLLMQGKINDEDDNMVSIRLLVPSKVIGCIIGKSGSIINEIRKRTKADIRISKGDKPKCADVNDELVEVGGIVDLPSVLPPIPPPVATPLVYNQRTESETGLGMFSSASLYGFGSLSMGENGYGSMPPYAGKLYGGLPPTSTLDMLIPASAVSKVLGKGGANIANIRKISGAMIEISDSKSAWGDCIALISGTPEQKRAAENLIQAFIMAT